MNFKGHCIGGVIASGVVMMGFWRMGHHVGVSTNPELLAKAGVATLFFSLFPDLDVQSVPQKWFYRGLFCLFIYLAYLKKFKLVTLFAILGILPLLSHHRGWTHQLSSLIWFPCLLAVVYEYFLSQESFWYSFSLSHVLEYLKEYHWLIISTTVGWATHLFLDTRFIRRRIKRYV